MLLFPSQESVLFKDLQAAAIHSRVWEPLNLGMRPRDEGKEL